MNFQEVFDNAPPIYQAMMRGQPVAKRKEMMLILYTIEQEIDRAEEILQAAGVPHPQACKKCWERYHQGSKNGVPVLCSCVYKNLEKREGKLLVEWEEKNGQK